MRVKDDVKKDALVRATVELVNQVGFAASSVAKIAKEAGVSSSTLYVYFDNKEDLLISTYIEIKQDLSEAMLEGVDSMLPIYDILRRVWFNTFNFVAENPQYYAFMEQFAASPYTDLVDKKKLEKNFRPLLDVLQRGIDEKVLKNVGFDFMAAFIFAPVSKLANPSTVCLGKGFKKRDIEIAFSMAWDAIRM